MKFIRVPFAIRRLLSLLIVSLEKESERIAGKTGMPGKFQPLPNCPAERQHSEEDDGSVPRLLYR